MRARAPRPALPSLYPPSPRASSPPPPPPPSQSPPPHSRLRGARGCRYPPAPPPPAPAALPPPLPPAPLCSPMALKRIQKVSGAELREGGWGGPSVPLLPGGWGWRRVGSGRAGPRLSGVSWGGGGAQAGAGRGCPGREVEKGWLLSVSLRCRDSSPSWRLPLPPPRVSALNCR